LQVGDVITHVGGAPVHTPNEMIYRMSVAGLGSQAPVRFLRGGEEKEADVSLIAAPDVPARDEEVLPARSILPDMRIARVNPAVISELNLPLEATGVVVMDAGRFGPRVGLRNGDIILSVNGVEIEHPGDLQALFGGQVRQFELLIQRGDRRSLLRFRV
jgi:S1-C subfamily serine protease